MKVLIIALTFLGSISLFAVSKTEIRERASIAAKTHLSSRYKSELENCISMTLKVNFTDYVNSSNLEEINTRIQTRCSKQIDALTFIGEDSVNILTNEIMKYVN